MLSLLVSGAFALLLAAISSQHHAALGARHIRKSLIAADSLELLVLDTETGARGYIITGQPSFLQPWRMARQQIPGLASTLVQLAGQVGPAQEAPARRIAAGVGSYLHDYSDPLVALAQRNLAAARTPARTADGRHRVDALRAQFSQFERAGTKLAATRSAQVDAAAHRAVVAAVAAVAGSVVLILASGGWVARAVVRPVRRSSQMADQVAGGDLAARLPQTGRGEIGTLERSLNAMTVSLAAGQEELRRTAAEQAALRRVATLVARGVPPPEVFGAVAEETGRVLQAECAAVARFGPPDQVTVVGTWGTPGMPGLALDSCWPVAEGSTIDQVRRTQAPARVTDYRGIPGELPAWAREQGIRSSVGTPITVEGGVWGAIIAFSDDPRPAPPGTEERMLAFTELVAMAIANSESRAQLTASRARVVAAADETRRRIERDLHDGSQQQLLSIALELRAAQAQLPPGQEAV
ncbi:MAG TPA: CHASE3 domain-containing protein, partial [Streptosporangiaceae bacterium]|nr:CHASE3 domain-containing protein [Streptosporangiaceae bacterium]